MAVKRYACTLLYVAPGRMLRNAVVEVENDGSPVRWYALREELPFTEWLGGTVVFLPEGVEPAECGTQDLPLWMEQVFREAGEGAPLRAWWDMSVRLG